MIRRAAALVLAAVVLLLAGCSDIPTSGKVQVGPTQDVKNQDVVLVPYKPAAGASQTDIVQGFITAATGQQSDYAVAREFLTPALAKRWKPGGGVLIHDQAWQLKAASDTSITVTVPTTAQVDAQGVYTSYATPRSRTVHFQLVRVNGQWRIASTPDGIVLGTNYFGSLFSARPVYFFDPTWSQPVPDLRWFPASAITARSVVQAARSVVQALLAGPSGPIAPPVTTTAFAPGTKVRSVQVSQGVATVDLHTGGPTPSLSALRRMRQQLTDSLQSLKGVQQVQVSVDGTPMPAPLLAPTPGPNLGALVMEGNTVGYVAANSALKPEPVLGKQIAAAKPIGGTVSVGRRIAALLVPDRGVAVVTPSRTATVDDRAGLIVPTLDDHGWTYSVPMADPSAWKVVDSRGRTVPFAAGISGMLSIFSIEASRDGTRMLVLGQDQAGPTAFVAGIIRDSEGTPLGLTAERYSVDVPATTNPQLDDATWVDAAGSSVAVLTQDDTGDSVTVQQLGGLSSAAGRLSTTVSIVGTSKLEDLRALLQNGSIAEVSGTVWTAGPAGTADVLFVQR